MSPKKKQKTTNVKPAGEEQEPAETAGNVDNKGIKTSENCPSLTRCIERWGLIAPYKDPSSEEKWAAYLAERFALEFRHETFFPQCNDGKELSHYQCCYNRSWGGECSKAAVVEETADSPRSCSNCKKHIEHNLAQYSEEIKKQWSTYLKDNETLRDVYAKGEDKFTAKRPPFMDTHCLESYADDCHESGTTHGQYTDFRDHIQDRIKTTIESTTLFGDNKEDRRNLGEKAAAGLFVLEYYANFEFCSADAAVRTVDFMTRLYSPFGNGTSIDLYWYRHYRARDSFTEKYSTLHACSRDLEQCDPMRPTYSVLSSREGRDREYELAVLDGDTDEDNVHKSFALLDRLKELRSCLFGPHEKNVSPRKVFGLLARASGAHAVREEGGWVYAGMRKRYELYPGEESDGEEDGDEDGPSGCCIM